MGGGAWDNINLNFRNTEYYATPVACTFDKLLKFGKTHTWDVKALSWAFMFVSQIFASDAIRHLRASVGEPTAVISAHRVDGGGELRLSLSSPFDLKDAQGFRCPLYPRDRVADVATMLIRLLGDCAVGDIRLLDGIHADRVAGTTHPLLFKPATIPAGANCASTERGRCGARQPDVAATPSGNVARSGRSRRPSRPDAASAVASARSGAPGSAALRRLMVPAPLMSRVIFGSPT